MVQKKGSPGYMMKILVDHFVQVLETLTGMANSKSSD